MKLKKKKREMKRLEDLGKGGDEVVLYRKEWDEEEGLTEQTYNVCDSLTEGRRKKSSD